MKKILVFAFFGLVAGCTKEKVTVPLPVISINTPANNQHFVKGETIHISGTITHSKVLTEVAVHMTDQGTKVEFFHNHFSGGNMLTFNYDSNYIVPDNTKSTYKVEIEATDLDGTIASREITVTTN